MKTIKTIPTLMLAASLGAGMILVSEGALARTNDHQEHSDHQDLCVPKTLSELMP